MPGCSILMSTRRPANPAIVTGLAWAAEPASSATSRPINVLAYNGTVFPNWKNALKNCSSHLQLETLAEALIDGLRAELYLTPKPGLVDLLNNGSHPDLSLLTMSRSLVLMRSYLQELCNALAAGAPHSDLILIGQRADRRMLNQLGTNCHRGGIFLSGLLLAACRKAEATNLKTFPLAIKETAEEYFHRQPLRNTHGQQVREQYRVGGIVAEARNGLPAVFEIALPILLDHNRRTPCGCYLTMARLMRSIEDTTSLFRCGERGLVLLRRAGEHLEQTILLGEDPLPLLIRLDREFTAQNLTMGGIADLLGVSFGYCSYLLQSRGQL